MLTGKQPMGALQSFEHTLKMLHLPSAGSYLCTGRKHNLEYQAGNELNVEELTLCGRKRERWAWSRREDTRWSKIDCRSNVCEGLTEGDRCHITLETL